MRPSPLIDVHCHLLPELDDGAAGWDEALAMARLAVADGISTVIATTHQLGPYCRNHARTIRRHTDRLRQLLREHHVPLHVLPGAEVRVEPDLVRRYRCGELLTLADRSKHLLLELPHDLFLPIGGLLRELKTAGIVGILAHPERNLGVLANRELLLPLVEAGCLMQVTSGSLVGTFGAEVQKLALWLVRQGLVHLVGTDAHGARARRPLLYRAFEMVADSIDSRAAVQLCCGNPAAVVAGETVMPAGRTPKRSALTRWLQRRRAG